jgi:hypothetical protein
MEFERPFRLVSFFYKTLKLSWGWLTRSGNSFNGKVGNLSVFNSLSTENYRLVNPRLFPRKVLDSLAGADQAPAQNRNHQHDHRPQKPFAV